MDLIKPPFFGAEREAKRAATPQNNRFHRVFGELAALDIHAEPTVYADDIAEQVRDQLLAVDCVLVWVSGSIRSIKEKLGPSSTRFCVM